MEIETDLSWEKSAAASVATQHKRVVKICEEGTVSRKE